MKTLPFKAEDLIGGAGAYSGQTRRSSISGVQDKVQLPRKRGGYEVVESGGTHILKPVPRSGYMRLAEDVPPNEALTMDIAQRVFRIPVARHELVRLADGELAYLTERFDRQKGRKILQEDFCQLSGRSPETHGANYKFVELGACFGVVETEVYRDIERFPACRGRVERLVEASALSAQAKELYLAHFHGRLRAIAQ